MLNLIRMNLFRMVHTKSVIVVFCLLMLTSLISSCMVADDSREIMKSIEENQGNDIIREMTEEEEEEIKKKAAEEEAAKKEAAGNNEYGNGGTDNEEMSADFGIYVSAPVNSDGTLKDYVYIYISDASSGLLVLFILIGAILFLRGDEKNGFIKNIAGQTKHRYNILVSKLVVIWIYTFICMVCYMLVGYITFITGFALDGGIDFGIEYLPEAIKIFALQYLLYVAFISGLLLVTEVTRTTATGITIGFLVTMGFGRLFVAITQKMFNTDFDISKYYISTNISKTDMSASADVLKFALVIGIVYFILYNALNIFWFSKKDIV